MTATTTLVTNTHTYVRARTRTHAHLHTSAHVGCGLPARSPYVVDCPQSHSIQCLCVCVCVRACVRACLWVLMGVRVRACVLGATSNMHCSCGRGVGGVIHNKRRACLGGTHSIQRDGLRDSVCGAPRQVCARSGSVLAEGTPHRQGCDPTVYECAWAILTKATIPWTPPRPAPLVSCNRLPSVHSEGGVLLSGCAAGRRSK